MPPVVTKWVPAGFVAGTAYASNLDLRTEPALHELHAWDVERRPDGAVLVRVHSRIVNGRALPDAVFAFRAGDPQFSFWEEQLRHREILSLPPLPMPVS